MKAKQNAEGKPTKKKKKKEMSKPLLYGLLGGGALVLLMCVGCTGVSIYFFAFRGNGPGLFDKAPEITMEKFTGLDSEMTIPEVDAYLGGKGVKHDRNGMLQWTQSFQKSELAREIDLNGDIFVIYRNSNRYMIVGFVPSPKYGELSISGMYLEDLGHGTKRATMNGQGFNADAQRDRAEIAKKILADPKWKKGEELKSLLVGTWGIKNLAGYEFKKDGTMVEFFGQGKGRTENKGTYKFIDDSNIEMTRSVKFGVQENLTTSTFRVLVAGDELILQLKMPNGKYVLETQTHQRVKGK